MHRLCAPLLLVAAQDDAELTQFPLRARVAQRITELDERSGWQRLTFDERWNDSGCTSAGIDGLANVITTRERDFSHV